MSTIETCASCGDTAAVSAMDITEAGYLCGACARSAATRHDDVDLEIGAFTGPAVKRARMWLLILGGIYLVAGAFDYYRTGLVWVGAISLAPGLANVGLSIWARSQALLAFYGALGVFIAHTGVFVYLIGPIVLVSEVRLFFLLVLVMGFLAARKAERLRQGKRDPAPDDSPYRAVARPRSGGDIR